MTFPIHNPHLAPRPKRRGNNPRDIHVVAERFKEWMAEDFGATWGSWNLGVYFQSGKNIPDLFLDTLETFLGQRVKDLLATLENLAPGHYERLDLTAGKIYKRSRDRKEIIGEIVRKQQCWRVFVRDPEWPNVATPHDIVVVTPEQRSKLLRMYATDSATKRCLRRITDDGLTSIYKMVADYWVGEIEFTLRRQRLVQQLQRMRDYDASFQDLRPIERRYLKETVNTETRLRRGSWPWPIFIRPLTSKYDTTTNIVVTPLWDVMLQALEESVLPFVGVPEDRIVTVLPGDRKVVVLLPSDLQAEADAQGSCVWRYKAAVKNRSKFVFAVRKPDNRPSMTFSFAVYRNHLLADEYKGTGNRLAGIKDTPEGNVYEPWEIAEAVAATIAAARWIRESEEIRASEGEGDRVRIRLAEELVEEPRTVSQLVGMMDVLNRGPEAVSKAMQEGIKLGLGGGFGPLVSEDIWGVDGSLSFLPAGKLPELTQVANDYEAAVPGTRECVEYAIRKNSRTVRENPLRSPPYRIMGREAQRVLTMDEDDED